MYTKRIYRAFDLAMWTRFDTLRFIVFGGLWITAYEVFGLSWLRVPWPPLALIGTAVAFLIGFQNNAAYGRIWEARKIWGGIVNTSRTFGMFAQDMLSNEHARERLEDAALFDEVKVLTYRHIAWMTALRHAMRIPKPWETSLRDKSTNSKLNTHPPELDSTLEQDLKPYLSDADFAEIISKSNKQTALLYLQSHHLRRLKESGVVW